MSTAVVMTHDYATTLTNYRAYAEARLGGNGDAWGAPEVAAGKDDGDYASGRTTWDSNLENGFDTGWNFAELTAHPGGGQNGLGWEVADLDPITDTSATYGHLNKVDVRALAAAGTKVQWSSISVTFYKNGVATDGYSSGSLTADATSETNTDFCEQILEVTSGYTDNDAVVVSGNFRMLFGESVIPGPTDIAAQIFLFGTAP